MIPKDSHSPFWRNPVRLHRGDSFDMVSGRKRRCPEGKNSMTSEARRAETCLDPLGKGLYSVHCLLLSQNTRVCIGVKKGG